MKCGYSKEILALYIENDLPTLDATRKVELHVSACRECRQYCDQLRQSQSFIKSGFCSTGQPSLSQEVLTNMRHGVMSRVNTVQHSLGWAVRLERFLMFGLRTHGYAVVGFALVAIVSASLLAQIRHSAYKAHIGAAVFAGEDTLLCPSSYREWVFVGCSLGKGHAPNPSSEIYQNVYVDPVGYGEYSRSGRFPDGTVMVLEGFSAETKKESMVLQVSVKDSSRFEEGWGFYDFTGSGGKLKSQAKPLPETAGCLACHRDKARL
jgi:Cytochrome P460